MLPASNCLETRHSGVCDLNYKAARQPPDFGRTTFTNSLFRNLIPTHLISNAITYIISIVFSKQYRYIYIYIYIIQMV